MKIVFLAPFGVRPKGTVIARMIPLAASLQDLGHEVVIVAPPYTNPEDSGKSETIDGVKVINIELGPSNKVLAVPVLGWRLLRAALAEKPALVHLFKPKGYGGIAAMLHVVLQRFGVRLPPLFLDTDDWEGDGGMNELHGYSGIEKRFYRFQEQWITRHVSGVSVASLALRELVEAMGIEQRRLLYLPNCVTETSRGNGDSVRSRLAIPKEAPVLLLYTRFFEFPQEKLHLVLERIHRQVPEARFLVVGKGRQGEEVLLEQAAAAKGFADVLVVAGWVEPAQLPDYLAAGDVAIYPFSDTLVNRCKCPAKLTELLLAGVPVVADRVGQIIEYVEGDSSGVLCDPGRWQEMADHAATLLRDPQLRRSVGEAGRRQVVKHFNWPDAANRLDGWYRAVMGEASPERKGGCSG